MFKILLNFLFFFIHNRGHGTYNSEEDRLLASVAGVVERVNKLICVKPLKTRYLYIFFTL